MTDPLLCARDLTVTFRPGRRSLLRAPAVVTALAGVTVELSSRGTLGVLGPSGSGKSTLARCLVGLVVPDRGLVALEGNDIATLRGARSRAFHRRVQYVSQNWTGALDPRHTVRDAIAEPALFHQIVTRAAVDAHVRELLDVVGLTASTAQRRPQELSGGQVQRVVLARAVGLRPDVLIADEVVSALDPSVQARILTLLTDLRERLGLALVVIDHDPAVVSYLADDLLVMRAGRVVERGTADKIVGTGDGERDD